ncbi:MAG: hypothetical protein NTV34_09630 [Proteobacteria bacterium]|nr:hypothetical protein [Pseudomonadota bacterium]
MQTYTGNFTFKLTAISVIAALAVGCGKKKDDSPPAPSADAYTDQNLLGHFSGKPWEYGGGRAVKDSSGKWSIELTSVPQPDACTKFGGLNPSDKKSLLMAPKSIALGRTDFAFETDGLVANFSDYSSGTSENNIAVSGFIEITAVTASSFNAKLVATIDSNDSLNGKFTAAKCCAKTNDSFSYEVCQE